jgi:hypothetical protein
MCCRFSYVLHSYKLIYMSYIKFINVQNLYVAEPYIYIVIATISQVYTGNFFLYE